MENKIEIAKSETQKKKRQINFVITSEFAGNKKLSELIENLIKSEINKVEAA